MVALIRVRGRGRAKYKEDVTANFPVEEEYIEENPGTSQTSYSLHLLLFSKSPVLEFLNNLWELGTLESILGLLKSLKFGLS